ncbi:MAG: hypothetical protein GY915_08400, partial [bacterium]|nr:hypothetical protein [bacterium]
DVRPDIVLSMAVRCEEGAFYSALGIHKNRMYPTYRMMTEDPTEELPYYKGISPLFHAVTANFVRELGQNIDVALVRPLSKMQYILLDMDVPSFAGAGKSGETSDEIPYLLRKLFLEESGDSSVEFHHNPLVFVFPKEGKVFQMPSDYWFSKSPFGGYTDFRELKKMMIKHNRIQRRSGHPEERVTKFSDVEEANPFVTIPLENLAEYRDILELME